MRVGSTIPKMESKSMATKLSLKDEAAGELPDMDDIPSYSRGDSADANSRGGGSGSKHNHARGRRATGKRARDESADHAFDQTVVPPTVLFAGLDMASVSALGRELMERKRIMLSPSSGESEMALPKGSDEESDSGGKAKAGKMDTTDVKSEPISEEDMQKRKAQRRREQVRAASRRCRDRQRRETEELRMKVFQLEEFISHTMHAYESELRRQRHQMDRIQQESDALRASHMLNDRTPSSCSSTTSVASSPASVSSVSRSQPKYGIKPEPILEMPTTTLGAEDDAHITWDPVRTQNMHETVEDCKRAMVSVKNSTVPPVIRRQAFGWNLEFWSEDSQYFVKTRKFFRTMRARDVAERNFNIDHAKYLETFPEVKEKKTLHWLSPSVKIVQIVKDLPGKGLVSSLSSSFLSRDEHFEGQGERWVVGVVSVGSAYRLKFSHEDECNGYIFEDTTRVTSDGHEVHGCLVSGTGRYESRGKELNLLMEDMAKIFASVVIRWEGLFINDYMEEEDEIVDELEF